MKLIGDHHSIFREEPEWRAFPWGKAIYFGVLAVIAATLVAWGWATIFYMEAPALVQHREFLVQSTETGRIADIPVKIGDLVSPQTVVAILDITRRDLDQWSPEMIFRAQDALEKIIAEAAVISRELTLKKELAANLAGERARAKNLLGQGVMKYSDYKKLDLDYQSLTGALGELQARKQALQAQRRALENIYVRHLSPAGRQLIELKPVIRGIVIKRELEPGDVVLPSQAILTLIDPQSLYVKAFFPEKYQPYVHLGNKVRIILPDGSQVSGEVQKLYPASEQLPPEYQKYYMTRQRAIVAEIIVTSPTAADIPNGLTVKARITKPLAALW
jgi:multidrug resistance efflux pump